MVRDGQTKYIFRRIADEKIPEEWAKRKKKGFPVPFGKWIREEKYYNKVKDLFNSDFSKEFFDNEAINKLLDEHYNGAVYGKQIYTIYAFLTWYQRFFITER